jgi:hypothetical protein
MAKSKPGLPEGFKLDLDSPTQLGDYLDEGFDEGVARAYVASRRTPPAPQPERVPTPAPSRDAYEPPSPPPRPQLAPERSERGGESHFEPVPSLRSTAHQQPEANPPYQSDPRHAFSRERVNEPRAEPRTDYSRHDQVLNLSDARRRAPVKAPAPRRPERMQFNMRPETLKMFNELVEFVQRYSLQDDAKASEILDAMISVLYQSRGQLAFHDVPRRGKWGTPTARAFPTALGNAFARAIAASIAKSGRGEA